MKTNIISKILFSSVVLLFCSCAQLNQAEAKFGVFVKDPNTLVAVNDLINAITSYTQGNTVGSAIAGVQGGIALVRALQDTHNAANPTAVAATVQSAGVTDPAVATATANLIAVAVSKGATPNAANEFTSEVVDQTLAK